MCQYKQELFLNVRSLHCFLDVYIHLCICFITAIILIPACLLHKTLFDMASLGLSAKHIEMFQTTIISLALGLIFTQTYA